MIRRRASDFPFDARELSPSFLRPDLWSSNDSSTDSHRQKTKVKIADNRLDTQKISTVMIRKCALAHDVTGG